MSEQPMPQDAAQENEQAAAEQAQAAEQPMTVDVILASGSPRRKELLEREGVSFTIRVSEVDESLEPDLEANPPEAVKKLAELGLEINSYADLLNPALNGKVIISDPTSSSAAWNNLSNIFAVYGNDSDEAWAQIEGMLQNGLIVVGSSSACFKSVQQGEYVVGLTYEDGASTLLKDGATNIKMVYPSEGSSAFAFAAAIVKNAPHMDAAKAMIEWLQSAEGQSYRANYVGTVRFTNENVVVEQSWLPESDTINWVTRDIDWLIANKTAMLDKWSELYSQYNG